MIKFEREMPGFTRPPVEDYKRYEITKDLVLVIQPVRVGNDLWRKTWVRIFRAGNQIVDILNGYNDFPFHYFRHNEEDFIFCPTECYTKAVVINLSKLTYVKVDTKGWCCAKFLGQHKNIVAVAGCYWGGPYDYRFYDVSNPNSAPILVKELDTPRQADSEWWDGSVFKGTYLLEVGRDGLTEDDGHWNLGEYTYDIPGDIKSARWVRNEKCISYTGEGYSEAFLENFADKFEFDLSEFVKDPAS